MLQYFQYCWTDLADPHSVFRRQSRTTWVFVIFSIYFYVISIIRDKLNDNVSRWRSNQMDNPCRHSTLISRQVLPRINLRHEIRKWSSSSTCFVKFPVEVPSSGRFTKIWSKVVRLWNIFWDFFLFDDTLERSGHGIILTSFHFAIKSWYYLNYPLFSISQIRRYNVIDTSNDHLLRSSVRKIGFAICFKNLSNLHIDTLCLWLERKLHVTVELLSVFDMYIDTLIRCHRLEAVSCASKSRTIFFPPEMKLLFNPIPFCIRNYSRIVWTILY